MESKRIDFRLGGDHVTRRRAQDLKGTFRHMAELKPAFEALQERYYLFPVGPEPRPGRPSQAFTVHPKLTEGWQ